MFIRPGRMVDVVQAGRVQGRFGTVEKIVFCDESGHFFIWVELFNPETGGIDRVFFNDALALRGRRYNEGELLAFAQLQFDAARPALKAAA